VDLPQQPVARVAVSDKARNMLFIRARIGHAAEEGQVAQGLMALSPGGRRARACCCGSLGMRVILSGSGLRTRSGKVVLGNAENPAQSVAEPTADPARASGFPR
jgi:hypothetical protein